MHTRNEDNRLQTNEISNLRLQDKSPDKNNKGKSNGNNENNWISSNITLSFQEKKYTHIGYWTHCKIP